MAGTTYSLELKTKGTEREYGWMSTFSVRTSGLNPKDNLFLLERNRTTTKEVVSLPRPVFEQLDFEKLYYTQHFSIVLQFSENQARSHSVLTQMFAHSTSETWNFQEGSEDIILKILSTFTSGNFEYSLNGSGVSKIQISGKGITQLIDKLAPLLAPAQ